MGLLILIALAWYLIYLYQKKQYEKTEYFRQTGNSYLSVKFDKGRYGEYLTYKSLETLPGEKKFLFNVYLPKQNDETTELDAVMIHESGIYVFESKNYSGWIFGSEDQYQWTQTLPNGKRARKIKFYNPIKQNKTHIEWILKFLGDETLPVHSYIVFSERCELKNIQLNGVKQHVLKRNELFAAVQHNVAIYGSKLAGWRIEKFYDQLYPLAHVSEAEKQKHIDQIQKKQELKKPVGQIVSSNVISIDKYRNPGTCPRCGGNLVLRTVKRGERKGQTFLGCSNFPKCRYMEKS